MIGVLDKMSEPTQCISTEPALNAPTYKEAGMSEVNPIHKDKVAECKTCGVPFMYRAGHNSSGVFCSRDCVGLYRGMIVRAENRLRAREVKLKVTRELQCKVCRTTFVSTNGHLYCSDACRSRRGLMRTTCGTCSVQFWTYSPDIKRCKTCRPILRGKGVAKKTVRRRIFERDKWICQICFEPIQPSLFGHDPMGPTIDHIIPICKGGSNLDSNLQSAHRKCNSDKGIGV